MAHTKPLFLDSSVLPVHLLCKYKLLLKTYKTFYSTQTHSHHNNLTRASQHNLELPSLTTAAGHRTVKMKFVLTTKSSPQMPPKYTPCWRTAIKVSRSLTYPKKKQKCSEQGLEEGDHPGLLTQGRTVLEMKDPRQGPSHFWAPLGSFYLVYWQTKLRTTWMDTCIRLRGALGMEAGDWSTNCWLTNLWLKMPVVDVIWIDYKKACDSMPHS